MQQSFYKLLLQVFEHGNLLSKLFTTTVITFLTAPIATFVWQFVKEMLDISMPDRVLFQIIVILLLLNTSLGMAKHWKFKTFNAKELLIKLMQKTSICLAAVVLFNVMNHIGSGSDFFNDLFNISSQIAIFSYLGIDSAKLIHHLSDGKMPPPLIMDRFDEFSKKKGNEL
jgi:hypothetical protein